MCDVIYKKFNWALFWPIWWSHLHYIVDFFQMYIILMSWMNSSWVFWKLSECKRPTWRQTLLRFSLKIFCLQDQWWSCKCWNFCAISMRLTSKPIGLCADALWNSFTRAFFSEESITGSNNFINFDILISFQLLKFVVFF